MNPALVCTFYVSKWPPISFNLPHSTLQQLIQQQQQQQQAALAAATTSPASLASLGSYLSPIAGLPTTFNGLTSGVVTSTTGTYSLKKPVQSKTLNFSGSGGTQSPHAVNGALAAAAAAAAVQGCPGTPSPVQQSTEPLTAAAVFAATTGLHPYTTCKCFLFQKAREHPSF